MRQFEPRVGIRTSSFGCQPGPLDLEVRRHNSATGISLSALGSFQAAPDLGAADDLPQRQRRFLPQPPGRAFATLLDRRYHLDVSQGVARERGRTPYLADKPLSIGPTRGGSVESPSLPATSPLFRQLRRETAPEQRRQRYHQGRHRGELDGAHHRQRRAIEEQPGDRNRDAAGHHLQGAAER
jgi:hypothetical protein